MHDTRQSIHARANGRWGGILSSLGVSAQLLNSRKHHPCLWCGGKDRFRFTDVNGSGAFYCNQCGKKSPIDVLMKINGGDFHATAQEVERLIGDVKPVVKRDNSDWQMKQRRSLWQASEPVEHGDFVDRYLLARGISMRNFPPAIRKISRMEHLTDSNEKSFHPGFVSRVRGPAGEDVNLHRTYLTSAGTKAAVASPRKIMAGTVPPGSAIRLYENPGDVLGIAEGVETALAAATLFRVPVWSAMNSKILESWTPPEGVKQVIVFGDNDPKFGGQKAAHALAHRLAVKVGGPTVRVEIPEQAGTDWNDVLMQKRGM